MKESISINYSNAILDFSKEYCTSSAMLLNSESFYRISKLHLHYLKRKEKTLYLELNKLEKNDEKLLDDIINLSKLLIIFNKKEIKDSNPNLYKYCENYELALEFIETLYNYWRSIERYAIIYNDRNSKGIQNQHFIDSHNDFENLVLKTYRKITEELHGKRNLVYRQLIAGVNAGIVVNNNNLGYETGTYSFLKNVGIIETIVLHPPFISYPRRNKRDEPFVEAKSNPLEGLEIDHNKFLCFPAMVGNYFAMIYFNKEFMSQGVTLANLFELIDINEVTLEKPDIVYVFGVEDNDKRAEFYYDEKNDIYTGYLSAHEDFDYFGYMKK
ncbi:MAG: hypothetical protein ACK5K7_04950 [Bacilli bacterium]